jgi:homoserine kinase
MPATTTATAFAPASVANVAVGFDILGFAFGEVGDHVTVTRVDDAEPGSVRLGAVENGVGLPEDPNQNTAIVALQAMADHVQPGFGFEVGLQKGIPPGSGMGSSAASAVGAVVAANGLLDKPFPRDALLIWSVAGEAAASGAAHGDNVAPCLVGGLCAILPEPLGRVIELPVPDLICVVVRPHVKLDTRAQRSLLRPEVAMSTHVEQAGLLAGFIAACYQGDHHLMGYCLRDLIVEPQRAPHIPGFEAAKDAVLEHGTSVCCSIAGSGPSLFAWAASVEDAEKIRTVVVDAFAAEGLGADAWIGPISKQGARITSTG